MENKERLLKDVREKFAKARELCPGMSEDIYAITDYMSTVVNDELNPQGLALAMALVMNDIQEGRNGFREAEPLPDYFKRNKDRVLAQIVFLPQVIDKIADEEYAEEFRQIVKDIFKYDPPKRVEIDDEQLMQYPENIRVAVNWWANVIQAPTYESGTGVPTDFLMGIGGQRKTKTKEQLTTFKLALAEEILEDMKRNETRIYGRECHLYVDYNACAILQRAGSKIGLVDMLDYPWKTGMDITEDQVYVYGADGEKVLWQRQKTEDMNSDEEQKIR